MTKFCQDFNPQFFNGSIFAIQKKTQIAKGLLSGHLRPLAWNSFLRPLQRPRAATRVAVSCEWLRMAANGCEWLRVAASGCEWLPVTAASGCEWRVAATGWEWVRMAANGCKWLRIAPRSQKWMADLKYLKVMVFAGTVVFSSLEIG